MESAVREAAALRKKPRRCQRSRGERSSGERIQGERTSGGSDGRTFSLVCTGLAGSALLNRCQTKRSKFQTNFAPCQTNSPSSIADSQTNCKPFLTNSS
jgi:hypothetical protein